MKSGARISTQTIPTLDFELPPELEADAPPEARGLSRDEVRLMVSYLADNRVVHTQFKNLDEFLEAGDVLVINTSGTMNAAINATRDDGTELELHLSTHLPADLWIVEVRLPDEVATKPFYTARSGETLTLPGGASVTLLVPYQEERSLTPEPDHVRLWIATLKLPYPLHEYLDRHGFPIRYNYVKQGWPNSYYQTVYANEMGSAEMPSAGRAFTLDLLERLRTRGVQIVPLILHTGVASLEDHEAPYEEYYRVPLDTAQMINEARAAGHRVIAVGTTVVRALETVTDVQGVVHPGEGWTRVIVTPARGIHAVNGMLTGLHEPKATHLAMIEALAGREHLKVTYDEALHNDYLWHEFGDLHLMLP
jgi:S-adenosylmethionine:tRNA ribosyltransferase-isomerase